MPAPSPITEICSSGVITRAVVNGYGLPTVRARAIPAIRATPGETTGISEAHAISGKARRSAQLARLAEPNSSRQVAGAGGVSAVVAGESSVVSVIRVNLASAA